MGDTVGFAPTNRGHDSRHLVTEAALMLAHGPYVVKRSSFAHVPCINHYSSLPFNAVCNALYLDVSGTCPCNLINSTNTPFKCPSNSTVDVGSTTEIVVVSGARFLVLDHLTWMSFVAGSNHITTPTSCFSESNFRYLVQNKPTPIPTLSIPITD